MRFLFTRRWVLFALVVAALAYLATLLGQWQFHRLDDRKAENALVARNLDRAPVAADEVLRVGKPVDPESEWRRVVVHGTWDDEHTIVLKYQTREGAAGVDVVTPLVTGDGAAVLVDRGWIPTENDGSKRPRTPAVTDGPVTVIGWVRADATGRAARVDDLSTRAVSSEEAAKALPYPVYGGFLDLHTEAPAPEKPLTAVELPDDTSNGPHFFYGLQWWFFGALAIFGFGYLAYDEWKRAQEDGAPAPDAPAETTSGV
ncbi:SURF1 family cytochrome oxidase biogenesis protein [Marmoricola sp. RAF53]|uniref:SURF1 family cytochrome oxidase biogenesis protein n=1 Tax=Marmoricola sp. RAF53 TaxID=3233059 RepID=UPI003F9C1EB5